MFLALILSINLSWAQDDGRVPDWTHVEVLLDRSGSMYSTKSDALGGYNSMLEEMKREQSESHKLTWSLNLFNHEYSEGERKDIGHCSALEPYEYHTEGSTALLDAVGKMLVSLEKNLENQDVQVLVLVITDGEENASSEWSKSSVKSLVSRLEEEKGWKFIFSAANQDAFTEGQKYGFKANQNFEQSETGYKDMYRTITASCTQFVASGRLSAEFEEQLNAESEEQLNAESEEQLNAEFEEQLNAEFEEYYEEFEEYYEE